VLAFVLRRLLSVAVVLVAVAAVTFLVVVAVPASAPPAGAPGVPARVLDELERVLRGDVGGPETSWRLPATLSLLGGALVASLVLGVAGGLVAALRPHTLAARLVGLLAALAITAPPYWLAAVSLYLLASDIGVLGLPFEWTVGTYRPLTEDALAWLGSLLVPWCVLALLPAAAIARVLRAALVETLREDHIRTAHAVGLHPRRIALRHTLRPALVVAAPAIGLNVALLVNASVLVEPVFDIPGIQRLAVDALPDGDVETIGDIVLLNALLISGANLVLDVVQAALDPRVRLRG
jgi:peptide/nickel transport system permease protein